MQTTVVNCVILGKAEVGYFFCVIPYIPAGGVLSMLHFPEAFHDTDLDPVCIDAVTSERHWSKGGTLYGPKAAKKLGILNRQVSI